MKALEYLKAIENRGYSCYVVGGYVRDYILGIESFDIDIATSATPREIKDIFETGGVDNLGCVKIVSGSYTIDITTYRRERDYVDRHPRVIEYTSDIDVDIARRDFTINAICMDARMHIYDPLNGREDLENKIIRPIGAVDKKFREDPLRMLRAIRLACVIGFNLTRDAHDFIYGNKELFGTISHVKIKSEMDKILLSKNACESIKRLADDGILRCLGIKVPKNFKRVEDLIGSWSQLECDLPFTKNEQARMKAIRAIVLKGEIDNESLFDYGIYDNLVAGEILGIDKSFILEMYEALPIKTESSLALNGNRIKDILSIEAGPIIKIVKKDLIKQILSGNLPNRKTELSNYIRKNWK